MSQAILYSYRRCPYAMRARMALIDAQIDFEVREISLKNKPRSMLELSPKGTVPVLLLQSGKVLEQSLDIMLWAYEQHPVEFRVQKNDLGELDEISKHWIDLNDFSFKKILDAYKYPERFPMLFHSKTRDQALQQFLIPLDQKLEKSNYLIGSHLSLVDIAIFPFVRQFAAVNYEAFNAFKLSSLNRWINFIQKSDIFNKAMAKLPLWTEPL